MNAHQQALKDRAPTKYRCTSCGAKDACAAPRQQCRSCRVMEKQETVPPFEQALREVEAETGTSRVVWESILNHPNNLKVLDRAKELAGITDRKTRPYTMRGFGVTKPSRKRTHG